MKSEIATLIVLCLVFCAALLWRPEQAVDPPVHPLPADVGAIERVPLDGPGGSSEQDLVAIEVRGWPDCGYDRALDTPIIATLQSEGETLWTTHWSGFARGDDRRSLIVYAPYSHLDSSGISLRIQRCPSLSATPGPLTCEPYRELRLNIAPVDGELEPITLSETERETLAPRCAAP